MRENSAMTVTQMDHDGNGNKKKHWGPERLITINRLPSTSLGISIVGGSVDVYNGISGKYENISGIFIKNISPDSPADKTRKLKAGDRIIEVDGVDLGNSTHEHAVQLIQNAGNSIRLLVQSLGADEEDTKLNRRNSIVNERGISRENHSIRENAVTETKASQPEVIQEGSMSRNNMRRRSSKQHSVANDTHMERAGSKRVSVKKSIRRPAPVPPSENNIVHEADEDKENNIKNAPEVSKSKYSSDESSEDEDTRHLEGNVYTKAGMEISRKSAGNVKRSKEEIEADKEEEDEFGYTTCKVQKKYHNLKSLVVMVTLEKDRRGLGISLSGHKDRSKMAVFICGINPSGTAHKTGGLMVGDEILEVNGHVLQNRCHLNASSIIKGIPGTVFKIIVVRRKTGVNDLAVKPVTQFPSSLEDGGQFSQYKGVHVVSVKKGQYGLGIMIIEGKHAEVGQGIFVSDIQEGSAAEQAGLQVGELILSVNFDCLLGSTYDEATSLLKKAEGVVTLTVCNPNQSKVAQEEEEKAKQANDPSGADPSAAAAPPEPEKPKEPEVPQDPKDCKILVGRDTTIEFPREKDKPIGFTVIGGSDTPLVGVFVLDVYPDGAAGKDGRLQPGDQILDFCHENFKNIEHEKAHASVLKAVSPIWMIVLREQKKLEEIDVELQQKPGKGLGLCITGFTSGTGAYISDLIPAGSAVESGKLVLGDVIIQVSGEEVRQMSVEDIALLIKASNPLQLRVTRYKSTRT